MSVPSVVVRRYYAYYATTSIGFYLPVSTLVLVEVRGFGLDAVGAVMAAYLVAMLVAEIPTGYLGDRVGRRTSLAVGNALMAASLVGWTLLHTPAEYALVNALWATGTTFRSGTASAWLYQLLDSHEAGDQFAHISGRATTVRLLVSAGAAVSGGVLFTVNWALPFLVNAALAALGVPLLATLPAAGDMDVEADDDADRFTVRDAFRLLRLQVDRPALRWFVAYVALFYGLFQLGLAFEQPAVRAVGVPVASLGLLYAGFKLVSAGAASAAGWLQDRLGARGVFGLAAPFVGLVFAAVIVWPPALLPALFFNRALSASTRPLRNQYLNDRLGDVGRATVLSGVSMALSLFAAGLDVIGGIVAEATGPVAFLAGAGVTTAAVAALLWLAVTPVRQAGDATTGGAAPTTPSD
ncbi:MFS transporter [Halorarius litoreus]|uniref:MFS transporter n=1 Tax=Halorarius litoreus TaxID=2962676 RepID=UPI0020CCB687|nr:MFS transporter [Halorarius litoreus]